jgi:hypothetical protein
MKIAPLSLVFFLWLVLSAGCRTEPKEFTVSFTMESVGSYKIRLEIDGRKNYAIEEQHTFFDINAGREQIRKEEGTLTAEEFAELKTLLSRNRLFGMKDAYGFSQEKDDALGNILYQIGYTAGGKEKYISIRLNPADKFPDPFLQLIKYLNAFISHHHSPDKKP